MEVLEHGWVYNEKRNIIKCDCDCRYKYNGEDIKSEPRMFEDYDLKWFY